MENLEFQRPCRALGALHRSIAIRLVSGSFFVVWQVVRLTICAVLILMEPLLRATLVPIAFLSFVVTLIFGFLIGDPRFPRWGMLAFSVGTLMLYWLFLGVMSLFMTLPRSHDR